MPGAASVTKPGDANHQQAGNHGPQIPAPDAAQQVALTFQLAAMELETVASHFAGRAPLMKVPDNIEGARDNEDRTGPPDGIGGRDGHPGEEHYDECGRQVFADIAETHAALQLERLGAHLLQRDTEGLGLLALPEVLQVVRHGALLAEID